jgi:hypothetical protein
LTELALKWKELTFGNEALVRLVSAFDSILKFAALCRQKPDNFIDPARAYQPIVRQYAMHALTELKFMFAHCHMVVVRQRL